MKTFLRDLVGFFILAAVSLVVGLGINALRSDPLPLVYQTKEERFWASLSKAGISLAEIKPVIPEL